jgi:hypothetical protein
MAMPKTYDLEYWKIGMMALKELNLFFDLAGKTEINPPAANNSRKAAWLTISRPAKGRRGGKA